MMTLPFRCYNLAGFWSNHQGEGPLLIGILNTGEQTRLTGDDMRRVLLRSEHLIKTVKIFDCGNYVTGLMFFDEWDDCVSEVGLISNYFNKTTIVLEDNEILMGIRAKEYLPDFGGLSNFSFFIRKI